MNVRPVFPGPLYCRVLTICVLVCPSSLWTENTVEKMSMPHIRLTTLFMTGVALPSFTAPWFRFMNVAYVRKVPSPAPIRVWDQKYIPYLLYISTIMQSYVYGKPAHTFQIFSWQLPVSQAFWEIASSHSLEDLMLAADIDRDFNSTAHNNSCISMSLTSAAMGLETCKQHTKTYQNLARTCVWFPQKHMAGREPSRSKRQRSLAEQGRWLCWLAQWWPLLCWQREQLPRWRLHDTEQASCFPIDGTYIQFRLRVNNLQWYS